mmetsp:Transcript_18044/g.52255  ORF Transcript_18044/g.52255 Transcript_18044/m.52255 type:complete len:146 (-) Transcript_18044:403-840(-)
MPKTKSSTGGGVKGFLGKAGRSFYAAGSFTKDKGLWLTQFGAKVGFIIATTSITMLMPLIFEISREAQVRKMNLQSVSLLTVCQSLCSFLLFCEPSSSLLDIQMIEVEKSQVKDLRSQGYADRQFQEMGFCEAAVRRAPSVAMAK